MRSIPIVIAASLAAVIVCRPAHGQELCDLLAGATVIADDGTFLGKVTSAYDSDSIFNEYGDFGSEYSSTSIWNEYGRYGGKYSSQSPFNQFSSTPPVILLRGKVVARLTVNRTLEGALNPYVLRTCED